MGCSRWCPSTRDWLGVFLSARPCLLLITALVHYCTTALLHYCTTSLLHYFTTALPHYCITALLHYCTAALLHYCTTALTTHYSLLTTHYSRLTVHYSLLDTRFEVFRPPHLLTTHYSQHHTRVVPHAYNIQHRPARPPGVSHAARGPPFSLTRWNRLLRMRHLMRHLEYCIPPPR